ncbi:hypothetical protein F5Y06DRAFT_277378 [Hypoxylon sp. FL0890]|nr:hypothetical protein F5Y06DRAFT_277378 [Hypoxylon sp. FL0890]
MAAIDPTVIAEISRSDLELLDSPPTASIEDVQYLSSYNWIEAPTPTIVVPGCPSIWSPPQSPRRVKEDSGPYYADQNAVRRPESPLEPLFRALYTIHPSFDIRSTDVVTDRNNIRKLLSFVNPSTSRSRRLPFTINIETIKNTTLFGRKEANPVQVIDRNSFRVYGHEFERVCTRDKIEGSTGHHRIISYSFGGLNFIVRHETDACVSHISDISIPSGSNKAQIQSRPKPSAGGSELAIRQSGEAIFLESTVEIKTHVSHKTLSMHKIVPQLWVSQTPKLVLAYHKEGLFEVPEIEDVSGEIREWERTNQKHLRQLVAVIRRIIDVAKGCDGPVSVNFDKKQDKLVVRKVDRNPLLPQDLYSKWD